MDKINFKAIVFLTILVSLAYFNSLNNQFVSDDIFALTKDKTINSITYVTQQPFAFIRASFNYLCNKTFGLTPVFFRLFNIFFHLGSVLAAYFLLRLLTGERTAFFAASIFAVHPVAVESVTWISGGIYSQYAFFLLLSFLLFVRSLGDQRLYRFSLLAYLLSLASHDMAMVLPLILNTYLLLYKMPRSSWKKVFPFFLLSVFWLIVVMPKLGHRIGTLQSVYYQRPNILEYVYSIPAVIVSYIGIIFWPGPLSLHHYSSGFSQNELLIKSAIFLLLILLFVATLKRCRRVWFWFLFFIISLLPTLSTIGLSAVLAERYVYLGSVGIFAIIAITMNYICEKKGLKLPLYVFFSILLLLLLGRTVLRNADWRDEVSLCAATLKTDPGSFHAHNSLGVAYSRQGNFSLAEGEFIRAIGINPMNPNPYHNLANVYMEKGEFDKALDYYTKAISRDPGMWQSYRNSAGIYFKEGKFSAARDNIIRAIEINPNDAGLHMNLGLAYIKLNDIDRARHEFEAALRLDPGFQPAKKALLGLN